MSVRISEKRIKSKIKIGETVAVIENIKYPMFEVQEGDESKKALEKINAFYAEVAEKYSSHARIKLPKRIKPSFKTSRLPLSVGMNYTASFVDGKRVSIVLDLVFSEGKKLRMKRFSQTWSVKTGEMIPVSEIIKTDLKSKKKILSMVTNSARENFENPSFGYYENYLPRLIKNFHVNNCFVVPNGIAFFVQSGVLRAEKYGATSFVLPYTRLSGIINPDFLPDKTEKPQQNENIVNNV